MEEEVEEEAEVEVEKEVEKKNEKPKQDTPNTIETSNPSNVQDNATDVAGEIDYSAAGISDSMNAMARSVNKKGVRVGVSFGFRHPVTGKTYYCVVINKTQGAFLITAEFVRHFISCAVNARNKKRAPDKKMPMPSIATTITVFPIRAKEYGDNELSMKSGGYYREEFCFVAIVPTKDEDNKEKHIKENLDHFFNFWKPRETNQCGPLLLNHLRNHDLYKGRYDWAIRTVMPKGKTEVTPDIEDAANKMVTDMLIRAMSGGPVYEWDCHLDRFFLDFEIKEFLSNYFGATCWADVSTPMKKMCYKNYPKKSLPVWNDIVQLGRMNKQE